MEKWKKKIIKSMVKEWSKNRISPNDIIKYFSDPKNYFEITEEMLNCKERSLRFKLIQLFWPIYEYFHKEELEESFDEILTQFRKERRSDEK